MAHKYDPTKFASDAQIRQAARDALADLQTIQNATFANNTQRDAAIKRIAEVLRHAVRVLIAGV